MNLGQTPRPDDSWKQPHGEAPRRLPTITLSLNSCFHTSLYIYLFALVSRGYRFLPVIILPPRFWLNWKLTGPQKINKERKIKCKDYCDYEKQLLSSFFDVWISLWEYRHSNRMERDNLLSAIQIVEYFIPTDAARNGCD